MFVGAGFGRSDPVEDVGRDDLLEEDGSQWEPFDEALVSPVGRRIRAVEFYRRESSEAHHLVVVVGEVQPQVETDGSIFRGPKRLPLGAELDPLVAGLAQILPLGAPEAQRRPHKDLDECVVAGLAVVGRLEGEALVEEDAVEAGFPFLSHLRLHSRVSNIVPCDRSRAPGTTHRPISTNSGEGRWLLARLAPRPPELELVDPVLVQHELLLREDPARADLGVRHQLEVLPERRIVVGADGAGQEETILPRDLLLDIDARRLVLQERLVGPQVSPGAHGLECGDREVPAPGVHGGHRPFVELEPRRRCPVQCPP